MKLTRRAFGALSGAVGATAFLPPAQAATITTHGVSAFGDLKYPSDFSHFDYADPNAPKGGTISFGHEASFDSLNPYALKGNSSVGIADTLYGRMIYDSMMAEAHDEPDSYYALVAESAELAEDRSYIIFNMRPEARFHDGTPITSADVVNSIELLRTKARPFYRILLAPFAAVTADGPHRVRYDFAADEPKRDLPMLAAQMPIFSKAHFDTHDFAAGDLTPPLGSGPYRIGRFEANNFIEFERVEDYWARDLPVNRGRDNFDRIRIDYYRDRTAAFEAFKAGQHLFNEEFWSKVWATGYEPDVFPAVGTGDVIREVLPDETVSGGQGFWFNHRRPIFKDVKVREAIGLAFDFEWSNERLFYGLYQRTTSFFQGSPMAAEGPPTPGEIAILEQFADQLPEDILSAPSYVPPVTDGSGRARRSLRAAARLLDEAGWPVVDGVRQKDGRKLEFEFLVATQGFARIINPMIKNLEKLGINATLREVDRTQYEERTDKFDFDITTFRTEMSLTPGVELRGYFHSSSVDQAGSRNRGGVAHPVVDALIEKVEQAGTRAELTDTVRALDRVMRAMHFWVPQWTKASHFVAYWDVFGRPANKPPYDRGVVHYWWQDAEKTAAMKAAGKI